MRFFLYFGCILFLLVSTASFSQGSFDHTEIILKYGNLRKQAIKDIQQTPSNTINYIKLEELKLIQTRYFCQVVGQLARSAAVAKTSGSSKSQAMEMLRKHAKDALYEGNLDHIYASAERIHKQYPNVETGLAIMLLARDQEIECFRKQTF